MPFSLIFLFIFLPCVKPQNGWGPTQQKKGNTTQENKKNLIFPTHLNIPLSLAHFSLLPHCQERKAFLSISDLFFFPSSRAIFFGMSSLKDAIHLGVSEGRGREKARDFPSFFPHLPAALLLMTLLFFRPAGPFLTNSPRMVRYNDAINMVVVVRHRGAVIIIIVSGILIFSSFFYTLATDKAVPRRCSLRRRLRVGGRSRWMMSRWVDKGQRVGPFLGRAHWVILGVIVGTHFVYSIIVV